MSDASIAQLFEDVAAQIRAIDEMADLARAIAVAAGCDNEIGEDVHGKTVRLADNLAALDQGLDRSFHELRYRIDLANLLYDITEHLSGNWEVGEVIEHTLDVIWEQVPLRFIVAVSGKSDLGPYIYRAMRGVSASRQYVGEVCPFPLWGLLARALLPRLDPDEPDYLIVSDIEASETPLSAEFPWMEHRGTLAIFPLRVHDLVVGGLLLGRDEVNAFDDIALCKSIASLANSVARAIQQSQMQREMIGRASQVVGLQLFTRAIATAGDLDDLLEILGRTIPEVIGIACVYLIFVDAAPEEETEGSVDSMQSIDDLGIYILCDAGEDASQTLSPQILELAIWVFRAAQPVFFDPFPIVEEEAVLNPEDLFYNEEGQAILIPVMIGNEVLAVFYVSGSESDRRFNEDDMVVLRTMTNSIAAVLGRL